MTGYSPMQMIVFTSPILIAWAFFRNSLNIPDFDLSHLVFDPARLIIGLLILLGGFALFTTTLVAIGAVMPTAKESGSFMGVMMALIFVPFYAISLIISDPHAPIVQLFTYFPFSSPVTALLRNAFGSLAIRKALIVIAILYIGATVMLRLAIRLFQHRSISYTTKINICTALAARPGRTAAPSTPAPAGNRT
jgi:ABC-2 type transport system permease protein